MKASLFEILMAEVLSEIAKHLAFRSKIIAKLCARRCMQFIRIYQVPEKLQKKWTDERIDLFVEDLRELFYFLVNIEHKYYTFNQTKIAKMKLVSFNMDGFMFKTNFDFGVLRNMKTLKKFVIEDSMSSVPFFSTDYQIYKKKYEDLIDLTVLFKTLDLKYVNLDHNITIQPNMIKHMKPLYFECQFKTYWNVFAASLRYVDEYFSAKGSEINNDVICNLKSIRLELYSGTSNKVINYICKMKLHRLHIDVEDVIYFETINKLIENKKIHTLTVVENTTDYFHGANIKFPIDIILSNNISYLYLETFPKYSDEEIKRIYDHGTKVIHVRNVF